jgi:hypothetical protein
MKKIIIILTLIFIFLVIVSCSENVTTISGITHELTSTESSITTVTITSQEIEYIHDIQIDNITHPDDLISDLIENDAILPHEFETETLEGVNKRIPIQCLRKVDDDVLYSIHKTILGTYVYYFYEYNNGVWEIVYMCRFSETATLYELGHFRDNNSTIEFIKQVCPSIMINTRESDGKIFGTLILMNGDLYLLDFGYDYQDPEYIYLRSIIYSLSIYDVDYFNMIFSSDLPANLINLDFN